MRARRRRRLRWWFLGLLIGYTAFGFLIAPPIIRAILRRQLPKELGRKVSLQRIQLNPFTFAAALDGLTIYERDGQQPFLGWDRVAVKLRLTNPFAHTLVLQEVTVSNAFAHIQVNHDTTLNFADIHHTIATNHPPHPSAAPTAPLTVIIQNLRITGSKVIYRDLACATPFNTIIGPINLTLHDFSTAPDNQTPYGFTAVTESGETFTWKGLFHLIPLRSHGEFAIENISLKKYAPYYDDFLNLTLHDGFLDVRAAYRVELTDRLQTGQLTNLTVAVRSLKIAEHGATNNVVDIPTFTIADTDLDIVHQQINVGAITTTGGRIIIRREPNGSVNLPNLFKPASTNTAPLPLDVRPLAPTNTAPWNVTVRDIAIADYAITSTGFFGEQEIHWQNLQLTGLRAQQAPAALTITAINLTNAALAYADNSLPTPATMTVTQFNALVTGLATTADARAEITVTGHVNGTAPIRVTGHVNPFNLDAQTDLQADCTDINLVPLGPYSGKFLGYALRKGRLSLAIKTSVAQRRLAAQNQLILDQFTFGEKTDSPDAVKQPVKLAVAILKDRTGRIALDLPVEGRVDDPQFRYGRALRHVLGTLFTKIFTAPFSMLGSMFGGGGDELGYQEFAPGSAEVLPDQVKKLDVLIKALNERPGLILEIQGAADIAKDTGPLKHQKLASLLRARKAKRAAQPIEQVTLTEIERVAYLREAYAEALPQMETAELPATAARRTSTNVQQLALPGQADQSEGTPLSASQARRAAATLAIPEVERQYLHWLKLAPEDFRVLATARANAVQQYLLQHAQLDPTRISITPPTGPTPASGGCRVNFSLQ